MTTIQRKISLSIHCQLLKISGGESGPKNKLTEKDISRIGLKVFAEFWSPSSALWECQSFGWFTKGKSTFFPWRISTGISVKKMRRRLLLCFKGLRKRFFSSMVRLVKVWKGNQMKRQRFLQGLVWLEECTKFPCWFIRSLSTERQSPSRRKSLSLSPCSSSALDDKEDNENDLITWMISLDQGIDNSAKY